MPSASTAELTRSIPFPDEIGEPIWVERRSFPIDVALGPPVAFLAVFAITARPLVLQLGLAAAAGALLWLLLRLRGRTVFETYTVSDRFVVVEQPRGGRVALPVERLTGVTLAGDKVRLETPDGVVTLGFVRRQRALLRTLERVAPGLQVEREINPLCPT